MILQNVIKRKIEKNVNIFPFLKGFSRHKQTKKKFPFFGWKKKEKYLSVSSI